jgi:hypothetical protein
MIREDKQNPGLFQVSYSKRHPVTGMPISLRRINIKSIKEAKRVEAEIILGVEDKIRRKSVPSWEQTVNEYCEHSRNQGYMGITIENYYVCLRAHTFTPWGEKLIDGITTDEIRELVRGKEKSHSVSHQKSILKMIRGVFKFAYEKAYIQRNPVPQLKFREGDKIKRVLTESQATGRLH